jgi:gamma-glutamylcyclotransferase (GGCT)/AIG2-like uncharacterized protein YtfP
VLYFAYGSNLSKSAMRGRAPQSRPLSAAVLPEHQLLFESNEPAGAPEAFFANVRAHEHEVVPGALYEIGPEDLEALDAYEDIARGVYERIVLSVAHADGTRANAVVYRMRAIGPVRAGLPSDAQLEQIRVGYADWDLDVRILNAALASARSKIA